METPELQLYLYVHARQVVDAVNAERQWRRTWSLSVPWTDMVWWTR